MHEALCTLSVAMIGAAGALIVTVAWKNLKQHHKDHVLFETYPAILEEHQKAHEEIKQVLEWDKASNVAQHRAQLMHIHDEAKTRGYISRAWYFQFNELCSLYVAMGGNGPIIAMKNELDEMVKTQGDDHE